MSVQILPAITLIDKARLGLQALSLDSLVATTAITVKAGSKLECGGALYDFTIDELESGGTWAGIGNSNVVYCYIAISGSNGTWYYNTNLPTWNTAKQGWYYSSDRCFAFLYKDSGGLYTAKGLITAREDWSLPVPFPPAPDPYLGRLHHLPLGNTTSRQVSSAAPPAAGAYSAATTIAGSYGVPTGAKGVKLKVRLVASSAAAGAFEIAVSFSDNNANTPSYLTGHPNVNVLAMAAAANPGVGYTTEIDVPLNGSGQLYWYTHSGALNVTIANCLLNINVVSYYMGD